MIYLEVDEDVARLTMFRNGEIDSFGAQPEQWISLNKDQSLLERTQQFQFYPVDHGYSYVAWNQRKGGSDGTPTRFADARVRRAMTMLLDRDRMAEEIFRGFARPASGPFSITSPQNAPGLVPWPKDVPAALALLKEAGFEDRDGDGVLEGADGKPFRFQLTYPNKSPLYDQIALFLKDSYARAGIVMEQNPTEWSIMLDQINTRNFDAISLGWTGGVETDIYQMYHSDGIADGGDNFINYKNERLDELISKARSTVDEDDRMPLWRECHRILHEDQPYTFLMNRESLLFLDGRIRNVRRTAMGLNWLSDGTMPIEWYVPEPLQKR